MSLPARDDVSRLEMAQQRLATALNRLEGALIENMAAQPVAQVPGSSQEDSEKLTALLEELAALKQDNAELEGANTAALAKVEETIARLKSVLAA